MIAFACLHCGTKLKVQDQFASRQSKCPKCKQPPETLRQMKGLKTIGESPTANWPAEQFWKMYDAGEFR